MEAPFLLPEHLILYESCLNDKELAEALSQKLEDLFLYFEFACSDRKWALSHSKFIRFVLRWVAKQFYLDHISLSDASRLVKIIQKHYSFLHPFLFFRAALFFTVKLRLQNQDMVVNSLLFGVGSSVLRNIFKHECFEKLNDEWVLPEMKTQTFQLIENYLYKGELPNLTQFEYQDIVDLMAQVQKWEIQGLIKECAPFLA